MKIALRIGFGLLCLVLLEGRRGCMGGEGIAPDPIVSESPATR